MMSLCTVEISVTDTNNNLPVFPSSFYEVEVMENVDPTSIVQVCNCSDFPLTLGISFLTTQPITVIQGRGESSGDALYQINKCIFHQIQYVGDVYILEFLIKSDDMSSLHYIKLYIAKLKISQANPNAL